MKDFTTDAFAKLADEHGLVFPRVVLGEIVAALDAGKHIMLTGAPGTGKTSLAYLAAELAKDAVRCTGYLAVTASSDWGAGETIGRYSHDTRGSGLRAGCLSPGNSVRQPGSSSTSSTEPTSTAHSDRCSP